MKMWLFVLKAKEIKTHWPDLGFVINLNMANSGPLEEKPRHCDSL